MNPKLIAKEQAKDKTLQESVRRNKNQFGSMKIEGSELITIDSKAGSRGYRKFCGIPRLLASEDAAIQQRRQAEEMHRNNARENKKRIVHHYKVHHKRPICV